jgi:hypothetical protein
MGLIKHLIKAQTKRYGEHGHSSHHHEDGHHRSEFGNFGSHHGKHGLFPKLLTSLPHKTGLLGCLFFAVVIVLVIAVVALVMLFPLLTSAVDYLGRNGIQGALEAVLTIIRRLWTGNG